MIKVIFDISKRHGNIIVKPIKEKNEFSEELGESFFKDVSFQQRVKKR